MSYKPIIVVAGDPNSVFLELYFKSIIKKKYKSQIILICCENNLKQQMKKFKIKKKLNILKINDLKKIKFDKKKINLINVKFENAIKSTTSINNRKIYINNCFEVAFKLIKKKFSNKLINGPINKKIFLNKKYLGVTEYISSKFKKKKTGMLIYNNKLSVSPITTHLPIRLVSKKINKKIIQEKILIINNFYKNILKYKPNIGVTGLNPHCETILKFNEDEKIVLSAIKSIKKMGIKIEGPIAADTIFTKDIRKKYDVIVGMYHDQVLTPIKTLFEFDAINITMGLPFLRISPDHGPNEKMFGKNESNPQSLIKALNFLDQK